MTIKTKVQSFYYVFRSAVTGRSVSGKRAKKHPKLTIREKRDKR